MPAERTVLAASEATGEVIVAALYHYPIKSCGGMALDQAQLGPRGFRHDREYMVVAAATGRFLTQRELPRLALIKATVVDGTLRVAARGMPALVTAPAREGNTRQATGWHDTCRVVDQGDEIAGWLSQFLQVECRLVRLAEDHVRPVDPAYATSAADQVGFADGYPCLLIAEESLADLNARLSEPLPMNRFRPNIVVAGGGAPYLEDRWRRVSIGPVVFQLVKPCARCVITTTDQETAMRGREPLTTLATYRRAERGVMFGQNLIHEGLGTIRRGQRVEVLA